MPAGWRDGRPAVQVPASSAWCTVRRCREVGLLCCCTCTTGVCLVCGHLHVIGTLSHSPHRRVHARRRREVDARNSARLAWRDDANRRVRTCLLTLELSSGLPILAHGPHVASNFARVLVSRCPACRPHAHTSAERWVGDTRTRAGRARWTTSEAGSFCAAQWRPGTWSSDQRLPKSGCAHPVQQIDEAVSTFGRTFEDHSVLHATPMTVPRAHHTLGEIAAHCKSSSSSGVSSC